MKYWQRIAVALTALLVSVGVGLTTTTPAYADTKGCTVYGTRTVAGYSVPGGSYCATIVGSGTWVSGVQGEFYAPNLCNWDVTAEFFDNAWNWKTTYVSGHNYNCSYGTAWAPYIGVSRSISSLTGTQSGYMCSTLRVGFQRVTSVCNYIY
ncbi:hypothetical protein [Dactylosporangium sp. NPDC000521]|uniref:hypothetical protein n=1 Tax=Dactylosporangium sp. NPDC000521 TaxID=3363975 RepID=UPI0036C143F5